MSPPDTKEHSQRLQSFQHQAEGDSPFSQSQGRDCLRQRLPFLSARLTRHDSILLSRTDRTKLLFCPFVSRPGSRDRSLTAARRGVRIGPVNRGTISGEIPGG